MLDWHDLLTAIALLLIIEGLLPFVAPGRLIQLYEQIKKLPENRLRAIGMASIILGLLLLMMLR